MQLRLITYTKKMRVERFVFLALLSLLLNGCSTPPVVRGPPPSPVNLPFLRLEQAGECYFIDDFLPTPDSLVSGKTSNLFLRYYTYWNARYKYWSDVGVMLAFYSRDMRCWALFEEYALPKIDN
ncbi:hypothetical protein [Silvanigrella sp.]|jgi:hypothetical protein|uniref:hypothetical protein n=1 Tax=Silvanigrella sp. TaxID=2024976 RepID=UPI0037CAF6C2